MRRDRRLPRSGCMACVEFAQGECTYRLRYGCGAKDRAAGLDLGVCVFELARRFEIGDPTRELLAILPEPDCSEALLRLEFLLDAFVYSDRSAAWVAIAGDAASYNHEDEEYFLAVDRYRTAGSTAVSRRYADLRPFVDRAKNLQAEKINSA